MASSYDQLKCYRNLAHLDHKEARDVHAEHKAIRDAVLNRDVKRACKENGIHIRRTAEVVARIIVEEKKTRNF